MLNFASGSSASRFTVTSRPARLKRDGRPPGLMPPARPRAHRHNTPPLPHRPEGAAAHYRHGPWADVIGPPPQRTEINKPISDLPCIPEVGDIERHILQSKRPKAKIIRKSGAFDMALKRGHRISVMRLYRHDKPKG